MNQNMSQNLIFQNKIIKQENLAPVINMLTGNHGRGYDPDLIISGIARDSQIVFEPITPKSIRNIMILDFNVFGANPVNLKKVVIKTSKIKYVFDRISQTEWLGKSIELTQNRNRPA